MISGIQLAILVEIDDAEILSLPHRTTRGFQLTFQQAKESRLAAAIWTNETHAHAGSDDEMEMIEQRAITDGIAEVVQGDELLGLPVGSRKTDSGGLEVRVRAFISASSPISSLALSMRALDLVVRALGPRRSHSISV